MSFVHLHTHTEYSLLDGAVRVPELVARAKELDMPAMAITDHGYMFGVVEFYRACVEAGIKPIIGCEVYFTPESRFQRNHKPELYHLILLARTQAGYENLMALCSEAATDAFYYKPRVDAELLERYASGLIGTSACMFGIVSQMIEQGRADEARKWAQYYASVFDPDCFYLELQNHGSQTSRGITETQLCDGIAALGADLGLPLVATNDIHYLNADDWQKQDYLMTINSKATLLDEKRRHAYEECYLKSAEEMRTAIGDYPGIYENTLAIAEACNVELEFDRLILPTFETPAGQSEDEFLRSEVLSGLAWRYGSGGAGASVAGAGAGVGAGAAVDAASDVASDAGATAADAAGDAAGGTGVVDVAASDAGAGVDVLTPEALLPSEVMERFEHEYGVVSRKGFSAYFLIVADFARWARAHGVAVGPGRGSAAGSIIAYALGITDVDPLRHGLLFERFLNEERSEMPDIDMDFDDRNRGRVIDYVKDKYGEEKVSQVITYSRLLGRAAVKDISRIMAQPIPLADRISGYIPPLGSNIEESLKDNRDFSKAYRDEPDVQLITDAARRIEGLIRGESVHPCAVLITPDNLRKFVPVKYDTKAKDGEGAVITQYDGETVASMGLLKMDFLGLRNLTVIEDAIAGVARNHGVTIDKNEIPFDDPETYRMLSRGATTGVFQLESAGMRRLLRRLQPTQFGDIVAVVALFRPGPLESGYTDAFVEAKNKTRKSAPMDARLSAIVEETYGTIVYQEQVMLISMEMCGFSAAKADHLRKAMGKKKMDILAKYEQEWIDGAAGRGFDAQGAKKLWDNIVPFAKYAFNKSHAAAYAVTAVRTAWLKAHYPEETMAAILSSNLGRTKELTRYVRECRDEGLEVLPPDVNSSGLDFVAVPGEGIRFGLAGIKGVGMAVARSILESRASEGPYTSLHDFAARVDALCLNKRPIEALIKAGAFDSTSYTRKQLFTILEEGDLLESVSRRRNEASTGQISMFDLFDEEVTGYSEEIPAPDGEEWNKQLKLDFEREMLGLYLSDHPLNEYREVIESVATASLGDDLGSGYTGRFCGSLSDVRRVATRKGPLMARARLEDLGGSVELIIFPKLLEQVGGLLVDGAIVCVSGRYENNERGESLLVDKISELVKPEEPTPHKLVISGSAEALTADGLVDSFRRTLQSHPGPGMVEMHLTEADTSHTTVVVLPEEVNVQSQSLCAALGSVLGDSMRVRVA